MARRPQNDPRKNSGVTDLRRYRRERERAQRTRQKTPSSNEPFLGRRKHAGLFLIGVIVVLAALWWFQRH